MTKKKYRTANIIIQTILEQILRASEITEDPFKIGLVKTQLIKLCGLKTSTADKYLSKMENAGYIELIIDDWGDREIQRYRITAKGKERYKWFVLINAELRS